MHEARRFVTGLNDVGRSVVTFDDYAPNTKELEGWPGAYISEVWVTDSCPVDNGGDEDRSLRPIQHDPTPAGTIFRVVEIPPEKSFEADKIDTGAVFESMGSENRPSDNDISQHPSMHFTNSVDYIVVISGEMHMLMEDGEVLLRQGDCVVQRGTKHAWVNRGETPCVIAAILIDAKPLDGAA